MRNSCDSSVSSCSSNEALINGFPDILDFIQCVDDEGEDINVNLVDDLPTIDYNSVTNVTKDLCTVETEKYTGGDKLLIQD